MRIRAGGSGTKPGTQEMMLLVHVLLLTAVLLLFLAETRRNVPHHAVPVSDAMTSSAAWNLSDRCLLGAVRSPLMLIFYPLPLWHVLCSSISRMPRKEEGEREVRVRQVGVWVACGGIIYPHIASPR